MRKWTRVCNKSSLGVNEFVAREIEGERVLRGRESSERERVLRGRERVLRERE